MEEINDASATGNATIGSNISNLLDMSGNEKPQMDTDEFETLEVGGNLMDCDFDLSVKNDSGILQSSGLMSTTRPLLTTSDDETILFLPGKDSDLVDNKLLVDERSSPFGSVKPKPTDDDRSFEKQTPAPDVAGDALSISDEDRPGKLDNSESVTSASFSTCTPAPNVNAFHESEAQELLPNSKNPKIDTKLVSEPENSEEQEIHLACDTIAQPPAVKSEVAMEAETSAVGNPKAETNCPFSPGSLFNPEKLHHTVAEYVYWRDVKKTGLVFGSSLVLLLSLTYFSLISVVAYVALALLCVTITFRVYKNVLQAVQKSNEGHPFKDYLEMDISLSPETVKETTETLVHHMNCVTNKLRSFFLVEDLVDSLKLGVFLWCMTYVGAWFNGMTLVILALVSVFTLPKVYETNKTQIDHYMNLVRAQMNDVYGKINAKIPLCKKKKEQ